MGLKALTVSMVPPEVAAFNFYPVDYADADE